MAAYENESHENLDNSYICSTPSEIVGSNFLNIDFVRKTAYVLNNKDKFISMDEESKRKGKDYEECIKNMFIQNSLPYVNEMLVLPGDDISFFMDKTLPHCCVYYYHKSSNSKNPVDQLYILAVEIGNRIVFLDKYYEKNGGNKATNYIYESSESHEGKIFIACKLEMTNFVVEISESSAKIVDGDYTTYIDFNPNGHCITTQKKDSDTETTFTIESECKLALTYSENNGADIWIYFDADNNIIQGIKDILIDTIFNQRRNTIPVWRPYK